MNLENEITPFVDYRGFVDKSPTVLECPTGNISDTSLYYILMEKNYPNDDWSLSRADGWETIVKATLVTHSLGESDILSTLAAAKILNKPNVANDVLTYIKRYEDSWGFKYYYAALCASGKYNPWKIWSLPFALDTAIKVATNNHSVSSWAQVQIVKDSNFFCKLASKVWYKRLYKSCPNGMKDVISSIYKDNHPFLKYFID